MTDVVILAEVEALVEKARRYEYVASSRTITAKGSGQAMLRCMGAGGGGASGANARGGNGGTVATKTITVQAGDQLVVTIPAGGARGASSQPGSAGGILTITRGGGTLISFEEEEEQGVEEAKISGIAFNRDEAKLTILGVPDQPILAPSNFPPTARLPRA